MSEKEVRLTHYDRSGAYVTPLSFVRLILGLVSPSEEVLGLDTSVQWVLDETTGRKVSGTARRMYQRKVTYDLDMNEPPIVRPAIRGHGIAVLIKDSWRAGGRVSEVDPLRTARGIPGVVEMLAYQDYCAEARAEDFVNRVKLRVVLMRCGNSIWYFKDTLYGRGVLHRDVSMQNILFGLPDDPDGGRGCLIDLDVAVRTENGVSPIPMTPGIGTHLYQSILDYMDDLEGFFYVLCHLVFLFSQPGVTLPEPPEMLIPAFWGDAVRVLVDTFRAVVIEVFYRKARIAKDRGLDREGRVKALATVSGDVDVYFGKVKSAFDTAISDLEEMGLGPDERELDFATTTTTPSSVSSLMGIVGSREPTAAQIQVVTHPLPAKKRTAEDGQAHGTPHKRRRNAATETTVEDGINATWNTLIDALF
ncbi:hypothetical protein FA13DRAFT_1741292 [Coprinellus micaceus]|uniref:Fungal-type protein kinase domain-containing protein n=1 Tax=Coprinellus micaceus TaxID=71717 RepID=A0A4Y7SJV2_COPMI|nr:hypothetical protein FA13DRAFT_1741292 [Coprinellus micaceus]